MKKKLLLGLLPALMVLSACGGAGPKQIVDTFLEDTLVHEEIFGSLEEPNSPFKSIRNLGEEQEEEPVAPKFYVQYAETKGMVDDEEVVTYVSVRYVAAIKIPELQLVSYSATWARSIYLKDGTKRVMPKGETIPCTKVYTSLNGGSSSLTPSAYNPGSNYFVVYTLRNIPADQFGGSILASLTIDDNDPGTDPVVTKTIATCLEEQAKSARTSFDTAELSTPGYFLKGSFGTQSADPSEETRGENNEASFTVNLQQNDTFVVVNHDISNSKFQMFGVNKLGGIESDYLLENSSGTIKAKYSGNYVLFLNEYDYLFIAVEDGYYLTGDFCDWKILPQNIMGAGDDDYHAKLTNYVVPTAAKYKIVGICDGVKTYHGKGAMDDDAQLGTGIYNIYLGNDYHFFSTVESRSTYFLFLTDGGIAYDEILYAYMYGDGGIKNADFPGVDVSTLLNEYGYLEFDATAGYTDVIFSIRWYDVERVRIEVSFSKIEDGSELKHSSWYEGYDRFWVGYRQYGQATYSPEKKN